MLRFLTALRHSNQLERATDMVKLDCVHGGVEATSAAATKHDTVASERC
jgi:hypothetical protein